MLDRKDWMARRYSADNRDGCSRFVRLGNAVIPCSDFSAKSAFPDKGIEMIARRSSGCPTKAGAKFPQCRWSIAVCGGLLKRGDDPQLRFGQLWRLHGSSAIYHSFEW
jgi:hypothetical protein